MCVGGCLSTDMGAGGIGLEASLVEVVSHCEGSPYKLSACRWPGCVRC